VCPYNGDGSEFYVSLGVNWSFEERVLPQTIDSTGTDNQSDNRKIRTGGQSKVI